MKSIPLRHHAAGKRKIRRRLDRPVTAPSPEPVLTAKNLHSEAAAKTRGIAGGGIGAIPLRVRKLGLAEASDERLHLLKFPFPYHESDHALNFASKALGNGPCLDDIEMRRNDVVFLDARGADRIPDPTTAGDFCRRFSPEDVETLSDLVDQTRIKVWQQQPSDFFDEAVLDVDGTLVATGAGCKQGVDIASDGPGGDHPLIIALANTGELPRPPQYPAQGKRRKRPEKVKDRIVRQRGFETLTRIAEEVAVVDYRPTACHRTYRLVIVRQTIAVEEGQTRLFDEIRSRFSLTNDRKAAARALVFQANGRCDQENLITHLKGGVDSRRAAVDNLVSTWAYLVMTSLAWNLKA